MVALSAPRQSSPNVLSILLISPPLTFFWELSFFTSKSLSNTLRETLSQDRGKTPPHIRMIYGTKDDFTRVGSYRSFSREMESVVLAVREVEGATHFYRSREEGERLVRYIREWLDSV